MTEKFIKLSKYKALSNESLEKATGGDLWSDARDWIWGFKNGFEGRPRHHRSWRDRD